jgi:hypothetical protein
MARQRMELQSQLAEHVTPVLNSSIPVLSFFVRFKYRMIDIEESLLDQESVYMLGIIQSKWVCLERLIICVYYVRINFLSELSHK